MAEIKDKLGRAFEILPFVEKDFDSLGDFYDQFEPKGEYQGIPPANKQFRRRWIKDIISGWQNFLIFKENYLIGHVAVSIGKGSVQELIIFLHQDYRGLGIGSKAISSVLQSLKTMGFGKLWLTVQNTNLTAMRCFSKVGFEFTSPSLEPEREMILELENPD